MGLSIDPILRDLDRVAQFLFFIVEPIDPLGHNVDGGLALFSLVHLNPFEFLGFIFIFVSISLT